MIITNEPVDCYLIDWFGQKRHNTKNIWFSVRGQTDNYIVKPKGTLQYKYKKDAFYAYKAWLSDDPFVHICGKRYVDRVEDTTKVTVYSNQPEVELFCKR